MSQARLVNRAIIAYCESTRVVSTQWPSAINPELLLRLWRPSTGRSIQVYNLTTRPVNNCIYWWLILYSIHSWA